MSMVKAKNPQKTANLSSLISSIDVAKILGVNVATVKRWTDSGKLECVKTAGGHRKFELRHLAAFASSHEKYTQRLSLLPLDNHDSLELSAEILNTDLPKLIPRVLQSSIACDHSTIKTILNGLYMVHQDLVGIYQNLLTPVLQRVGEMWMKGELSVSQEHLASQTIRDAIIKLQDIVVPSKTDAGKVFVLTLSEELHDIPAKMIQHILESRGFHVLFSGQKTPAGDTLSVFNTFKPDRVYLSVVYLDNVEEGQAEYLELESLCKQHGAELYAGGAGLDQLIIDSKSSVKRLTSLREVQES